MHKRRDGTLRFFKLALAGGSHLLGTDGTDGETIMARPCTRFITDLSNEDLEFLLTTWRTHKYHAVRCRAHAIVLSSQKVSVPELTQIFGIDDDTARSWLTRWEERGSDGLEDEERPGGPSKLDAAGSRSTG